MCSQRRSLFVYRRYRGANSARAAHRARCLVSLPTVAPRCICLLPNAAFDVYTVYDATRSLKPTEFTCPRPTGAPEVQKSLPVYGVPGWEGGPPYDAAWAMRRETMSLSSFRPEILLRPLIA